MGKKPTKSLSQTVARSLRRENWFTPTSRSTRHAHGQREVTSESSGVLRTEIWGKGGTNNSTAYQRGRPSQCGFVKKGDQRNILNCLMNSVRHGQTKKSKKRTGTKRDHNSGLRKTGLTKTTKGSLSAEETFTSQGALKITGHRQQ